MLDQVKVSDSFPLKADQITKLITNNSSQLLCPKKKKRGKSVFVKLPVEVKTAGSFSNSKDTFEYWKQNSFPNEGDTHDEYCESRKAYKSLLRDFLNEIESDRISKLCAAADSDEKLFWKLLKGQRCSSQMRAFLVDGKMVTDKGRMRDMWADHFEALGTPLAGMGFDDNFCARITNRVKEMFEICVEDPSGVLNELPVYEEVARVCSRLKRGVSGVLIDYEHIRFGVHQFGNTYVSYIKLSSQITVSADLKT